MKRDDGFENLRALFAADLLEKVNTLKAAVTDADWEEVSTIAHQISGTAKSFGYPEISSVGAELERSAAQKSLEYAAELVDKLTVLIVL